MTSPLVDRPVWPVFSTRTGYLRERNWPIYMCKECSQNMHKIHELLQGHISGLVDAMYMGTNERWEYSEPIVIGGAPGQYTASSPFTGACQWKCEIASAGSSNVQILISSSYKNSSSILDYTGASGVKLADKSFEGLALAVPANSSTLVSSEWYNLIDSENQLNVIISAAANAGFVNLLFRQKRITRM